MMRRPLLTALAMTALYAGVLVSTASAQLHTVRVTLVTGQVLTYTLNIADGATVSPSQLPALPAPVQIIQDLGPLPTPTPSPTQVPKAPAPTPTVPSLPTP